MKKLVEVSVAAFFAAFLAIMPSAFGYERVTYIHFDALGSPVAGTDEQGNVIWRETYQPYGSRIQNQPAAVGNSRWYTGHPQDVETGLLYAGARYYDPAIGRFYAVDPVSFTDKNPHSFNRYAYGNNNPYKFVDPDGNVPILAIIPFLIGGGALLTHSDYSNAPAQGDATFRMSAGDHVGVLADAMPAGRAISAGKGVWHAVSNNEKPSTLKPGPFAKESIPAHRGKPRSSEQKQINDLMDKHGCHTCGTKNAGTTSGNAVGDHQPAQALSEPKEFFPHCIHCSRRQGGEVLREILKSR